MPSSDKIKIVPLKYVEQIDAHNINIYVLVSVVHIYNCCISETSINLMWKNISWGNNKNFPCSHKDCRVDHRSHLNGGNKHIFAKSLYLLSLPNYVMLGWQCNIVLIFLLLHDLFTYNLRINNIHRQKYFYTLE